MLRSIGALALAMALSTLPGLAQVDADFELIEVRLVATDPAVEGPQLPLKGSGEVYELENQQVLAASDFAGTGEVTTVGGKAGFEVRLKAEGAKKIAEVSAANVGRRLAIVVDGDLVMVPEISAPITSDRFMLSFDDPDEAKALAGLLARALGQG